MDEAEGIYRGEVVAMMQTLIDIRGDTTEILAILKGEDMKRKKWTREELAAFRAEREARQQELQALIDRAKAELEEKRKSA